MIKSMTGYGKCAASNEVGTIHVELKSVNHRFRDINIKLPSKISFVEKDIKKEIESVILRGKVDAVVVFDQSGSEDDLFEVNLSAARSYFSALTRLKKELGLESVIKLSDLTEVKDIIRPREVTSDENLVIEAVIPAVKGALESLKEMRQSEGQNLANDVIIRLENISRITGTINERIPDILNNSLARLKDRISQLTNDSAVDDTRLVQEIAIIAEKSDITEEIVRINSHISQFMEIMKTDGPVGRKLDFIVQEVNREINTIGSKSGDSFISRSVVEIKAEIERIKEQVQNIE